MNAILDLRQARQQDGGTWGVSVSNWIPKGSRAFFAPGSRDQRSYRSAEIQNGFTQSGFVPMRGRSDNRDQYSRTIDERTSSLDDAFKGVNR